MTDPLTSMKESHFLAVHLSVYHCYLFRFMSDYHCVVHQRSFGGGVGSQTVASLGDFAGFFVHHLGSSDSITVGVSMHALQWPTSVFAVMEVPFTQVWNTGDYRRLLEITGDYWRLLEITEFVDSM